MSSSQKGHIFISYRRADSEGYAGRIYDRITPHFGVEAVFMDVDTIDAGVDFVKVLEAAVQSCDVLVALIGRRWLNLKDVDGARRLDNPADFVRVEIATALERDIRVIPVLVGGASMPSSTELPENLQTLARRNALTVNHATFHTDMSRLIEHLERALQAVEDSKILKTKKVQEEQARKKRQSQVEKLLHQANTAINLSDWKLAGEKLKEILVIDSGHLEAQAKLELMEEKLAATEEQRRQENKEKEEARKRREKREQEAAAEENARRAALRKERQQEIIERYKKYFANQGKLPYFIGGGIVLLFALGYIISNIEFPAKPEPTKTPAASTPATAATSTLPISTATPIRELGVGSTMVSEKDGMKMVYVPAGEFQMGSEDGEDNKRPVHSVYLDAYWIDQTEVTNSMYARCVEVGECDPPSSTGSSTRDNYYGNPEYDDYPVIFVSWNDAETYCEWTGRHLPTEAEWEKAASWDADVGMQRIYPWGDTSDESYANYNGNIGDTTPVGKYKTGASYYGAYDMAGNVLEWVVDWYGSNYYASSQSSNPTGPLSGDYRALRGGSWFVFAIGVRSADRIGLDPAVTDHFIGFRCARSAAAPEPNATSLPESTATAAEIPSTPTPEFGVGSTMVSEKDGMIMVYVPAGEFEMGSEDGDDDEKPVHTVYLDAYWIDQTEVTNEMYAECVQAGACDPPRHTESDTRYSYYGNPEFDDYPVIWVDWGDAKAYCEWADRNLPSEAEWEKAARGGLEGKIYPWGDDAPICEYGAVNGAKFYDCNNKDTESVGSYAPNGYGVYDMAGNVIEWISSLYQSYPYNAMDGREDLSASDYRMKRGGSWGTTAFGLRSASRVNVHRTNAAYQGTGFRCSLSAAFP